LGLEAQRGQNIVHALLAGDLGLGDGHLAADPAAGGLDVATRASSETSERTNHRASSA